MTEEWLDFIVSCRRGISHTYDIVEGPMADDTIYNYIQNFMDGKISRAAFWELARFKLPDSSDQFPYGVGAGYAAIYKKRGSIWQRKIMTGFFLHAV